MLAFGSDGTLYYSALVYNFSFLNRTPSGVAAFSNTELGRVYDDANCYPTNVAQGRARLSFEQFRVSSFPSLAIDPVSGKMAIACADDQGNPGCGGSNPAFSGLTDNPGADKVYPAVGMNAGRTVVGYYTRDYSPKPTATDRSCERGFLNTTDAGYPGSPAHYIDLNPVCLDYAYSSSNDAFTSETRVSTQSSNPYIEFSGSFIGDYTGVAVDSAGSVHTVWTDFRVAGNSAGPAIEKSRSAQCASALFYRVVFMNPVESRRSTRAPALQFA